MVRRADGEPAPEGSGARPSGTPCGGRRGVPGRAPQPVRVVGVPPAVAPAGGSRTGRGSGRPLSARGCAPGPVPSASRSPRSRSSERAPRPTRRGHRVRHRVSGELGAEQREPAGDGVLVLRRRIDGRACGDVRHRPRHRWGPRGTSWDKARGRGLWTGSRAGTARRIRSAARRRPRSSRGRRGLSAPPEPPPHQTSRSVQVRLEPFRRGCSASLTGAFGVRQVRDADRRPASVGRRVDGRAPRAGPTPGRRSALAPARRPAVLYLQQRLDGQRAAEQGRSGAPIRPPRRRYSSVSTCRTAETLAAAPPLGGRRRVVRALPPAARRPRPPTAQRTRWRCRPSGCRREGPAPRPRGRPAAPTRRCRLISPDRWTR